MTEPDRLCWKVTILKAFDMRRGAGETLQAVAVTVAGRSELQLREMGEEEML